LPQKTPDENAKLTLDEGAFQRLLSAAFVIQEHNDSLKNQTPDPAEFKASDLSEIAETQNLIRGKRLNLLSAAAAIVERSQKISHAAAGAIALLSKHELSYICSSGVAPSVGTTLNLDESLSGECIRTGQFISLPNLKAVARPQAELFLSRGMQGFASVPIHQGQQIAGVMELYFNQPKAVDATTLRICQLLAGLLTGALSSQQETCSQLPVARPGAPPSAPLDQLKPQLDRLLEAEDPDALAGLLSNILSEPAATPASGGLPEGSSGASAADRKNIHAGTNVHLSQPAVARCQKCGCPFEVEESFCGLCGTARGAAAATAKSQMPVQTPTPRPVATNHSPSSAESFTSLDPSVLSAPHADKPNSIPSSSLLSDPVPGPSDIPAKSEELPPELQEILARFPEEPEIVPSPASNSASASAKIFDSTPLDLPMPSLPANKDTKAKFAAVESEPDKLKPNRPASNEEKPTQPETADTKQTALKPLNVPVTLPAVPSGQIPSADATANPHWKSASETRAWLESVKTPPQRKHWMAEHRANLYLVAAALLLLLVLFGVGMPADLQPGKPHLGWFDSMLVNLGLAEAPSTPVFLGNPATKVWVDLHTALYYCPNAELYGKTRGGKFEPQREAQQDQFEPATRHACP